MKHSLATGKIKMVKKQCTMNLNPSKCTVIKQQEQNQKKTGNTIDVA